MPVVELRQYTLRPGRRDDLITLFEREFVESQEDVGITLIGQFRDLDDPDRFVWLRSFPDMQARQCSLDAFYGGPVWQAHRNAANATMLESDDVLLLRSDQGFPAARLGGREHAGRPGVGLVLCGVHRISGPDDPVVQRFGADVAPGLAGAGLTPVAVLLTEPAPNNFPRLPVREGEQVLVWFAVSPDPAAGEAALARARRLPGLMEFLDSPLQLLRLHPTGRSRLHG